MVWHRLWVPVTGGSNPPILTLCVRCIMLGMSVLHNTFGKRKVFLPVIHTKTEQQVIESVGIAVENGADGVFLIDQHMHESDVIELIPLVRFSVPSLKWLGLNLLSQFPSSVLNQLPALKVEIDGIWSDSSGVGEDLYDNWVNQFATTRTARAWKGLWFGGIAFKYRKPIPNDRIPELIANSGPIDVVTTTGLQTGTPAGLAKVNAFHTALGDRPLALASGITPENIDAYLPMVDAFLVATGIERKFGELDAKRVRAIADRIAAFNTAAAAFNAT